MAVGISGTYSFDECADCIEEFDLLIQVLDRGHEDGIDEVLQDSNFTYEGDPDILLTLPCGGIVELTWDSGHGDITAGYCG